MTDGGSNRVRHRVIVSAACVLAAFWGGPAAAQAPPVTTAQVEAGADIYQRNCSPCHGPRMQDPQSAFNLRNFPADQHDRFITSVTRGKNQMPPWGDMLKPEDVEALWAYVTTGER
jgi:mono/diheme cytochrome c family protein